jgi:hypothetical protein
MKKIFVISIFILAFAFAANAQNVCPVNSENQADVKLYVVNYESQADLYVYNVNYEIQSAANNGKWYFVDCEDPAMKKVYFVENENKAQIKIFFVDDEDQAGWKNKSKSYLLQ